jgi:iron complex outermembrane recepter protein
MKSKNYIFLILLFTTLQLFSRNTEIQGTVKDENGNPIAFVSVQVKGTSHGTISDHNGEFSLLAATGKTLIFSIVGYESQEIALLTNVLNVVLKAGVSLDEIVVVGSRNPNRSVIESAVPIDVIDVSDLLSVSPQVNLNQLLNYAAPSFSSSVQNISDGTDHIDPASLRGLGTDQVLVLIHGKRRHTSSLINVNGTFGRGSAGTDLNAIPTAAIKRIEVLRDGAAAQYGSDAIAGVINIILNSNVNELRFAVNSGANFSKNANGQTGGVDGERFNFSANYGLPIGVAVVRFRKLL